MKIITNLAGMVRDEDCSKHPIRQSQRAGIHMESASGVFRFLGVFDHELHLHHGADMVAIPLAELWKLAESAEPKFTRVPEKATARKVLTVPAVPPPPTPSK